MARLAWNAVANYVGRFWTVLLGVAFVPIYLALLGIEAYGLIGIYAALQALVSLFDLGLGTTLNRQLSLQTSVADDASTMRRLTRTIEVVYWSGALVLILVALAFAPMFGEKWIQAGELAVGEIQAAMVLIGIAVAFQFPFALYSGGLLGLQRHVRYNALVMVMGTIRTVGAVLVILFVSNTILAFFAWQAITSALQSITGAIVLWRSLPTHSSPARFDPSLLRGVWRFTAGAGGVAILGALLSQTDKVLLSRLLTLDMFGLYALAGVLGSSLYLLATPVFMTFFPRFSQLVAKGDTAGLARSYHQSCQLLSIVVFSFGAMGSVFAQDILLLWTRDAGTAAAAAPVARLLVISSTLLALNGLPYTLQLAHGWTRLALIVAAGTLVVTVPALIWATLSFEMLGAASTWIAINGLYTAVLVWGTHRRVLPGHAMRWLLVDVLLPAIVATAVTVAADQLIPPALKGGFLLMALLGAGAAVLLTTAASAPAIRSAFIAMVLQKARGGRHVD